MDSDDFVLCDSREYVRVLIGTPKNERFEESVERAAKEGKVIGHALKVVEKAGNLTIEEEAAVREQLREMKEAEDKEQANDRAIVEKIKVLARLGQLYTTTGVFWEVAVTNGLVMPELSHPVQIYTIEGIEGRGPELPWNMSNSSVRQAKHV